MLGVELPQLDPPEGWGNMQPDCRRVARIGPGPDRALDRISQPTIKKLPERLALDIDGQPTLVIGLHGRQLLGDRRPRPASNALSPGLAVRVEPDGDCPNPKAVSPLVDATLAVAAFLRHDGDSPSGAASRTIEAP